MKSISRPTNRKSSNASDTMDEDAKHGSLVDDEFEKWDVSRPCPLHPGPFNKIVIDAKTVFGSGSHIVL